MFTLFNNNSDCITIECPSCRSTKTIKKTDTNNLENRRAISCRCTCGTSFKKIIAKKDPSEMDVISAIARLEFGVLWYKIQHPFAFLNG